MCQYPYAPEKHGPAAECRIVMADIEPTTKETSSVLSIVSMRQFKSAETAAAVAWIIPSVTTHQGMNASWRFLSCRSEDLKNH